MRKILTLTLALLAVLSLMLAAVSCGPVNLGSTGMAELKDKLEEHNKNIGWETVVQDGTKQTGKKAELKNFYATYTEHGRELEITFIEYESRDLAKAEYELALLRAAEFDFDDSNNYFSDDGEGKITEYELKFDALELRDSAGDDVSAEMAALKAKKPAKWVVYRDGNIVVFGHEELLDKLDI